MEYIKTDTSLSINGTTLIPVVRICINANDNGESSHNDNKMGYWFSADKGPLAIILCDNNGVRVLTVSSSEISIDSLLQKIPELNTILMPYRQHKDDNEFN